ncbi:hypothetical protein J5N97_024151 [Dioscorea zingiberensis]|uniref:C2H2-type domain-containing protein n=1 Tax=Dioscorea zingiberensis TaxID=325984 RepID=A0A9D5H8H6_9LILI|nr:hypothetical protein J5N97_024151 [Dioscorea zingiberensis]
MVTLTPMEEVVLDSNDCMHIMVKGKRTKRQRLSFSSPPPVSVASSPSTSDFSGSVTEEEEDMANCLILLAQGPVLDVKECNNNFVGDQKPTSRRFTETATTTDGKAGFYVYECKDCKKCFPSFQALGGHRTSHKRKRDAGAVEEDELQISMNSFARPVALSSTVNNNNNNNSHLMLKTRVHECSICGAEFSSGQALGGHMRRHRPGSVPEVVTETKKEKSSMLSLDLNLPAPPETTTTTEMASPAFSCTNKRPLLLLTSAMVDCHY